jgi:hypothetical protein
MQEETFRFWTVTNLRAAVSGRVEDLWGVTIGPWGPGAFLPLTFA